MRRKILKATDVNNIKLYIREKIREDVYGYSCGYYEWLLENDNLTKILVYIKDEKIVDFISIYKIEGITTISPRFSDCTLIDDEISTLKDFFKDEKFIIESEYIDYEDFGLKKCIFTSSLDEKYIYPPIGNLYLTFNDDLVTYFRDDFERKRFPELKDLNELEFKIITNNTELVKLIISSTNKDLFYYPAWKSTSNNFTVAGFHYFDAKEVNYKVKYLVALKNDCPVGVIKLGVSEREKCQVLCYIDVNKAYQNRGVAKKLTEELSKHLFPKLPLKLTSESDMGKTCHMEKHFKNAKYPVQVYTEEEYMKLFYC